MAVRMLYGFVIALVVLGCSQQQGVGVAGRDAAPGQAPAPQPAPPAEEELGLATPPPLPLFPPPPPPRPDTRSPDEIANAACLGADGKWHCPKRPLVRASSGAAPIIPAAWTVPNWYIDPSNSTTCASDSNSCTSATCGAAGSGTGPCATYQAVSIQRWGTYSPRLAQSTTLTFLSSHTNGSDPVYFFPYIEAGAVVSIQGVLGAAQQVATGTLSNLTARNQAAGTNTLLLAQSGATAVGQLVVNATHPSRAWTYAVSSGSIFKMSQPLVPVTLPIANPASSPPAEVNTWANGDAVTVYTPVSVNLVGLGGPITDKNAGGTNPMTIYQLAVMAPVGLDPLTIQAAQVYIAESQINRVVNQIPISSTFASGYLNDDVSTNAQIAGTSPLPAVLAGGQFRGFGNNCMSCQLVDDFIIGAFGSYYGQPNYNSFFVDSGFTFNLFCDSTMNFSGAGSLIWGPGTINIAGRCRLRYQTSAATNLHIATILLNGVSTAHSIFTSSNVDTPCGGITLSAANIDAAASATCATSGFGGTAFQYGGASLTNAGQ